MWIDAPEVVVKALEDWALVRPPGLGKRLGSDDRVLRVDATNTGHNPVELEAFPMLCEAVNQAIRKWWSVAKPKRDELALELDDCNWSVKERKPGVLGADPLSLDLFGFLAGTTTVRMGLEGPRMTCRVAQAC
jgi:hypothetical protein